MKINKKISKYNSSSRYIVKPSYIVIHYVGAISSAKNNCIYFAGGDRQASAHYFCDSAIWQSIDTGRSAWHCGGGLQDAGTANGGARLHGICKNQNSIGIELCCTRKNGKIVPSDTAIKTAVPLVKWLMQKYNIPASRVIRHFDVTGKCCPNGYTSASAWAKLHKTLTGSSKVSSATITVLKKGSKGNSVKTIQKNLNKLMKSGLETDGIFGAKTETAVKKFQKKYKLEVDGIVGAKTQAKIKALI